MGYIGAGPTRFNTADELTVTGDAEFNGNLTVKGTTTTIDSASVQTVDLGDNDKIRLGDGDDLQIYHDGSNSYIQDVGTGNLFIQGESAVYIRDNAGAAMAVFNDGGAVQLRYNGLEKLATTSTGVDVTGTLTSDGLTVDGDMTLNDGSPNLRLQDTDVSRFGDISYGTRVVSVTNTMASGEDMDTVQPWIDFRFKDDGETREVLRLNYNGNVGIGTSSPAAKLDVRYTSFTPTSTIGSVLIEESTAWAQGLQFYINNAGTYLSSRPSGALGAANTSGLFLSAGALVTNDPGASNGFTATTTAASVYKPAGGEHIWYGNTGLTAGNTFTATERMRIDSSGNLLLNSGNYYLGALAGTDRAYVGWITGNGMSVWNVQNSFIQFGTNNTERMRLSGSGNLLVGTTNETGDGQGLELRGDLENGGLVQIKKSSSSVSGNRFLMFARDGSVIGSVSMSGTTAVAYNTSSDYRLKENVVADWDATTRLKQLKPARFEWIADGDDAVPVDGFLAHEVQDIVPEAITGTKDAMRNEEYEVSAATGDIYTPAIDAVLDEDGNEVTPAVAEVIHSTDVERPEELAEGQQWRETTAAVMGTRSVPDYQGIDQSKLVPLLVKTIQELEARITALETA